MKFKYDEATIVELARYFNMDLTALLPIRLKQDPEFVTQVREKAISQMNGIVKLSDSKMFYIGSVDFMVMREGAQNKFVILESNGGSSRGLLSLHLDQVELIFNAYKTAIDQCSNHPQKFILIGRMLSDGLYQEKIMLMEYLKAIFEAESHRVEIFTPATFNPLQCSDYDISFLVADYNSLIPDLIYQDKRVFYQDMPVDLLIGDGIARRFPEVSSDFQNDWTQVKTGVVNPIYHVTDDKFNTYVAEYYGQDLLSQYNIHLLKFGKVSNRSHLESTLQKLRLTNQSFIIKPFGGSGGAGILPILNTAPLEDIPMIIDQSIAEFHQKFASQRDPFPYTIQEMASFNLINWKGSQRTFDIRIYVAQHNGSIIPVGGEARIARAPFTGRFAKNEFVVNICGEWGVEFDRAYALSESALQTLHMSIDDLTDLFCASCQLFKIICENHQKILAFDQWNLFL